MKRLQAQNKDTGSRSRLDVEQFNTLKALKDPTHGGTSRGLVNLIGNGLLSLDQTGTQPDFG
jgi:hypothetical protein